MCVCVCVCVYVRTYVHVERERVALQWFCVDPAISSFLHPVNIATQRALLAFLNLTHRYLNFLSIKSVIDCVTMVSASKVFITFVH